MIIGVHSWPVIFASPCLGHEPKAKVDNCHLTTPIKFNHHRMVAMYFGCRRWIGWHFWSPFRNCQIRKKQICFNHLMMINFGKGFFRVYEF